MAPCSPVEATARGEQARHGARHAHPPARRPCDSAPRDARGADRGPDRARPRPRWRGWSGNSSANRSPGEVRASRNTRWPACSCAHSARDTTSRADSGSASTHSPRSLTMIAPSPRTASLTSGIGSTATSSARSVELHHLQVAECGPARNASARPCPRELSGLGVAEQAADAAGGEHHRRRPHPGRCRPGCPPRRPRPGRPRRRCRARAVVPERDHWQHPRLVDDGARSSAPVPSSGVDDPAAPVRPPGRAAASRPGGGPSGCPAGPATRSRPARRR